MKREERAKEILEVANYLIEHDCIMKKASEYFKIPTSRIGYYVNVNLRDLDPNKFALIREGFKRHKKNNKTKILWHEVGKDYPKESLVVIRFANGDIEFGFYYEKTQYFYNERGQKVEPLFWRRAKDFLPKRR